MILTPFWQQAITPTLPGSPITLTHPPSFLETHRVFYRQKLPRDPTVSYHLFFCSVRDQRLIFLKDVDGEYVRFDIRESQGGVDTYVEIQLIDVSTCNPVSDVYIDFWHGMSV